MSDDSVQTVRVPRPRYAEGTRKAILEAAKAHFAQWGYHDATLRGIAAEAAIDVALIKRYFGNKDGLFAEALKASFGADRLGGWNHETFPREVAELMAGGARSNSAKTQSFQFLLRAAASPTTAPFLNVAVQERFLGPIREWLGGANADARARALAAAFIGLLVECLIRDEPLKGEERAAFIRAVTKLFGDLIAEPAPNGGG